MGRLARLGAPLLIKAVINKEQENVTFPIF